jgi:hypothetical protein
MDSLSIKSTIKVLEKYLSLGHPPPGIKINNIPGAILMTCRELKLSPSSLRTMLSPTGVFAKNNLYVDWSKYKKREDDVDPIVFQKLSDKAIAAEARAKAAMRASITAETLRSNIFKLTEKPLEPPHWIGKKEKNPDKQKETMVLMLSDYHIGELVDLAQMGQRNSYDQKIAKDRLERLFQNVVKLGTEHWHGPSPDIIYILLMGDLISGDIHEELIRTNDLLSISSVQKASEYIIAGLNLLLEKFECAIRVISVPGNHSRTQKKPEAKSFAVQSYDTLISWIIESWFKGKNEKRISFHAPPSGDALITVHGWNILVTHGDRIGSKGGMGMIGPAATIARGMQRIIMENASDGINIDYVLVGHFHTALELEQGFSNGCIIGPNEYSKSMRMRPAPATQWLLSVHPRYGVARRWKIHVGDSSEGSIYRKQR